MVPSKSWLSSNLSALAAALRTAPRLPDDDGPVRLDTAAVAPVLRLATPSGVGIALNSGRDPLREAATTLESVLAGQPAPATVILIGLGLGFIVDAVEQRCPEARIIALEPVPGCVRTMLDRRDFTALIDAGRLLVLWGPDYVGASQGWRLLGDTVEASTLTIEHPVIAREEPEATQAARDLAARMAFDAKANAEARRELGGRYLLNTLANLPVLAVEGDASDLVGRFTGVPAVLVAAGPSLDRNIEQLREIGDRALLIAVDTALRPLLLGDVSPHLVVAVDAQSANARHLVGLPAGHRARLVAEASVDPSAFADFTGRTYAFRVSNHAPWDWLRQEGVDRAVLATWGSVLTSALDLAVRMGCNPIIFTGADLAFTGDRPYCRNTVYEEDWAAESRGGSLAETWERWIRKPTVMAAGVHGTPVRTGRHLLAFRDWLVERSILATATEFVNATGAGLLTGGRFTQGSVEAAVSRGRRPDLAALDRPSRPDGRDRLYRAAVALREGHDSGSALARWSSLGLQSADRASMEQVLDASLARLHAMQQARTTE